MKRIRINHTTEYHYNQAVTFGPHRALMRPREGHDVHIESGRLEIEPKATVRWLRDLYQPGQLIDTFDLLHKLGWRFSIAHEFGHFPLPMHGANAQCVKNDSAPLARNTGELGIVMRSSFCDDALGKA